MCAPSLPTLEECMVDLNPNSPKQIYSLVHLCAFSQVIYTLLTTTSKGLTSISNGS